MAGAAMGDQFPDLRVTLIEDDELKADFLTEKFDALGAQYLGRMASSAEVFAAFGEIEADPSADNLITRANVLFIDGNLSKTSDCGSGNQILGELITRKLAFPPRYYRYADGKPFPRVAYGCSMAPRNAFKTILAGFNFSPSRDSEDKLHSMFALATILLHDGTNEEPAAP